MGRRQRRVALEQVAHRGATVRERPAEVLGGGDLERPLDRFRGGPQVPHRLLRHRGDQPGVDAPRRVQVGLAREHRLGAAQRRQRVAAGQPRGRRHERIGALVIAVGLPRRRAERVTPPVQERSRPRERREHRMQHRARTGLVAACGGEVRPDHPRRVRGRHVGRGVGGCRRSVGTALGLGGLVAQPVHGGEGRVGPCRGSRALPAGGLGQRDRGRRGRLGAGQPPPQQLDRGRAADALEHDALAAGVDGQRGGGVERVRRGRGRPGAELGDPEMHEGQRATRAVGRDGVGHGLGRGLQEPGRRRGAHRSRRRGRAPAAARRAPRHRRRGPSRAAARAASAATASPAPRQAPAAATARRRSPGRSRAAATTVSGAWPPCRRSSQPSASRSASPGTSPACRTWASASRPSPRPASQRAARAWRSGDQRGPLHAPAARAAARRTAGGSGTMSRGDRPAAGTARPDGAPRASARRRPRR